MTAVAFEVKGLLSDEPFSKRLKQALETCEGVEAVEVYPASGSAHVQFSVATQSARGVLDRAAALGFEVGRSSARECVGTCPLPMAPHPLGKGGVPICITLCTDIT